MQIPATHRRFVMVARVSKTTPRQRVPETDDCVKTIYAVNTHGYAQIRTDEYGFILQHRYEYCKHHGITPAEIKGKILRHTCDTPACINPRHLVLGTQQDNMQDMANKGRKAGQKLTVEDVLRIRQLAAEGKDFRSLAAQFGVALSTVSNIVYRHKWKHI